MAGNGCRCEPQKPSCAPLQLDEKHQTKHTHTHTYAPHSQREADEIKKKRKHIPLVAFKVAQTAKHVDTDRVID